MYVSLWPCLEDLLKGALPGLDLDAGKPEGEGIDAKDGKLAESKAHACEQKVDVDFLGF